METKYKISLSKLGKSRKPFSIETCRKISNTRKGIVFSLDTKLKMSKAKLGKPLSAETRRKISTSMIKVVRRGEASHAWKGGVAKNHYNIRNSAEGRRWAREIKIRDNNTCQLCGVVKQGIELHAHHIYSFAEYKNLRTDLNNGMTLCSTCHNLIHEGMKLIY